MTICIGAICQKERGGPPVTVLCADSRLTFPGVSSNELEETCFKFEACGPNIVLAIAGAPSYASGFAEVVRRYLAAKAITAANVEARIQEPATIYKQVLIDRHLRRTLGISRKDFYQDVFPKLSAKEKMRYETKLDSVSLECWAVLSVYASSIPYLFSLYDNGEVRRSNNYAVTGSGYELASSILREREYIATSHLSSAMYVVYEAKRFAEQDSDIGRGTVIAVHKPSEQPLRWVSLDGVRELERKRNDFGLKKVEEFEFPENMFREDPCVVIKK